MDLITILLDVNLDDFNDKPEEGTGKFACGFFLISSLLKPGEYEWKEHSCVKLDQWCPWGQIWFLTWFSNKSTLELSIAHSFDNLHGCLLE